MGAGCSRAVYSAILSRTSRVPIKMDNSESSTRRDIKPARLAEPRRGAHWFLTILLLMLELIRC